MKYLLTVSALLILGVSAAFGVWFLRDRSDGEQTVGGMQTDPIFPNSNQAAPVEEAPPSISTEIESVYRREAPEMANMMLTDVAISGDYAIGIYSDENVGGMVAFKYVSGKWELLASDGGVFNVDALAALGVPRATAETLIQSRI